MDIQFAYNLERMLYYICNENSSIISELMHRVEQQFLNSSSSVGVQLDPFLLERIQHVFLSYSVSNEDTLKCMKELYHQDKYNHLMKHMELIHLA